MRVIDKVIELENKVAELRNKVAELNETYCENCQEQDCAYCPFELESGEEDEDENWYTELDDPKIAERSEK